MDESGATVENKLKNMGSRFLGMFSTTGTENYDEELNDQGSP
jgi:hypothetical protein